MFNYQDLWNPQTLRPGQTLDLCLGSLRLWIHRGQKDWRITHETEAGVDERCTVSFLDGPLDPEHEWTRWVLEEKIEQIQLRPRLPDRPFIVRPEMPMCLMPKQSVQFFVSLPVWVAVSYGVKYQQVFEVPTDILSNSWFGPFTEGELCYAVKTSAMLSHEDLLPRANRVVFPLEVRNASREKLNFERLCLRPQFLNIYQGDTRMWTSKARVSYRGEEVWSRIVYSSLAPDFDNANQLLGKAREPVQRGSVLKTFDTLRQRVDIS